MGYKNEISNIVEFEKINELLYYKIVGAISIATKAIEVNSQLDT